MSRESTPRTVFVATALAVVCSMLVSTAAVGLRSQQQANKLLEKQKNILMAAGVYEPGMNVPEAFQAFEPAIVDLETGEYVPADKIDPTTYDQREAANNPEMSVAIPEKIDKTRIGRRAKYGLIYKVKKDGKLDQVIVPIKGNGLWSTMYGFLALDKDGQTIRGVTFYEHAETAGLGGEVANPLWNRKWVGKKVYGPDGNVKFHLVKGEVQPGSPQAEYEVDGLSGATLTGNGVTNLMQYWLGEQGFGPYLAKLRKGGGNG